MAGVRYRGLDPRTRPARWGLAAVAVGIVAGATGPGAVLGLGAVLGANGQSLPWLFERLFAWLAYLALTGSVMYGLLLSTKLLDAIAHRPISFALHQELASFGLGLAGIHGVLLGLDHSVPFSLAQIVVPGLAPHAPLAVGFGQVSLYLMALVTASFYVRRHIGQRTWRTLHYLTFLAFAGATVHGIAAGTSSGTTWARGLYLGAAVVVAFLLTYRIVMAVGDRAIRRARSSGAIRPTETLPFIAGGRPTSL
jgi:sulfoxide reductase heme-binding subunit YedZ